MEFAGAIGAVNGPAPGSLPQVAFAGRSNVGKSSLINRFLGRTRSAIARVSATPGKTQEINFYEVRAEPAAGGEIRFFLVDLPGYGYARAPGAVRRNWRPMIEWYLRETRELRGVVQLIDMRHEPTAEDVQMVEYLAESGLPALFVLTKADKIPVSKRAAHIRRIVDKLGLDEEQVVPFSSLSGEGRDELLDSVESLLVEGDSA